MPYTIRKMPDQNCYRLAKPATKTSKRHVFAKCTTLANAKAQLRLLNAIKYGKNFVPRGSGGASRRRRTQKHRISHMKK
jgi:hypothetical protein